MKTKQEIVAALARHRKKVNGDMDFSDCVQVHLAINELGGIVEAIVAKLQDD